MGASIQELRKSLNLLVSGTGELVKSLSAHQPSPIPKIEFAVAKVDSDPKPKKFRKNIVSPEVYTRILNTVSVLFSEDDAEYTLPQMAKIVYNKGIRPQISPEDYVELIFQTVNEVGLKVKLEETPDVEGTRYRRVSND